MKQKTEAPLPGSDEGAAVATTYSVERLLLRPEEAAESLGISERALWTLTNSGEINRVKIGRSVRYDPRDLKAWIDKAKQP
jgi:excisionase family DNA binding protein